MGPGWNLFVLRPFRRPCHERTAPLLSKASCGISEVSNQYTTCVPNCKTTRVVLLNGVFKPYPLMEWQGDCPTLRIVYTSMSARIVLIWFLVWRCFSEFSHGLPVTGDHGWEPRHWPDARAPHRVPPAHESAGRWSHSSCQFRIDSDFQQETSWIDETKQNKHGLRHCEVHDWKYIPTKSCCTGIVTLSNSGTFCRIFRRFHRSKLWILDEC